MDVFEKVDELHTPGCPQCAVKHLSAAVYWGAAEFARTGDAGRRGDGDMELLARAYVNLGEVLIGYASHLWFAVGLLQAAEEESVRTSGLARGPAREARMLLQERGGDAVRAAMTVLREGCALLPQDYRWAHVAEAVRELPNFEWGRFDLSKDLVPVIEEIRSEFFAEPTVGEATEGRPEADANEKGGQ